MWCWMWATERQPGEAFADLGAAFEQLVARGFNTIRIDALWSWAFDRQGRPRGIVETAALTDPGYCDYCPGFTPRGGVRIDVAEEIIRLLRLAERHDVSVALTSWEFQRGHTTGFLADEGLRREILDVPGEERFGHLARECDLMLGLIKRHGLEKRIAYVEIHNELQSVWESAGLAVHYPALRQAVEEGLAWLQARHPDILFTDDYQVDGMPDCLFDTDIALGFCDKLAGNAQLVDHHLYAGGVQHALFREAGVLLGAEADQDAAMERLEREHGLFRWLLRPGCPTWREYRPHLRAEWFRPWWPLMYLYQNMDIDRYDQWMFRHHPEWEERMATFWRNYVQVLRRHARSHSLPIVCDEGYIFWPPIHSAFEPSAVGRADLEMIVDSMVAAGYWGVMVSTYAFPGQVLWEREAAWLRKVNERVLNSA
jgi:hypothetical protein